ncbi:MAG: DNA gyrase subunit A [Clostridiales bacterium]|nr:DNA gyrase subunit A [Clostridiales bacterium]
MSEKELDKVVSVDINEEMKQCYIDYAMSVIVARALPDVRDGLKPVQRRILYSMNEMNLDPNKGYRKSARIVGDTMGKYHPHGDSSIYQAMVRMAQNFSMRYMLVDGHGNFGSIDGYGAAASRYTEARMSKITAAMLADIDKNTVDFVPNYDENEKEPVVLPSRIPNLLLNGATGIAVGMATNIPPHNLGEVIDGVVLMIDNKKEGRDTEIEDLMEYIKGPDFPTGATILGKSGIRAAYKTGRGKIIVRSSVEIETMNNGRERIVVTEIPYMVNKLRLIEKIADLVKDKRVDGISDLYDASSGDDIKIIIELKKDTNANVILNQLYKYTQLQETFGVIMIALVNGKPEVLTLKKILEEYLKHQEDVVTRRTKFDLDKAQKRAHILEGLRIAIDNIDEVIQIIRTSYDNAKERLMERFSLSDVQAQAILDMQLKRLQGLEHDKIDEEYRNLMALIKELTEILADENLLLDVIKKELLDLKAKYNDERRTKIVQNPGEIDIEDLIEEEASVIAMTSLNYIKRTPLDTYKSQNRGGRGIIGMQTREEDAVTRLFVCSTHDYLLFFTNFGRVYRIKGYEVPEAGRTARGLAIVNLLSISQGETITAVVPVRDFEKDDYLVMVTKSGVIKKTDMSAFANIRKTGITAVNLREGDELIAAFLTDGSKNIFAATRNGMGIMFDENDVRPMGRTATGVKAITLSDDDYVVSADFADKEDKLLNVTENGYGKRTDAEAFNVQHRGGKGVKIHQITDKTGLLSGVIKVSDNEELMIVTSEGVIIRLRGKEISTFGRVSQGVKLINLDDGVTVAGIAKINEEDIMEEESKE